MAGELLKVINLKDKTIIDFLLLVLTFGSITLASGWIISLDGGDLVITENGIQLFRLKSTTGDLHIRGDLITQNLDGELT